jgi:hypothetical protein
MLIQQLLERLFLSCAVQWSVCTALSLHWDYLFGVWAVPKKVCGDKSERHHHIMIHAAVALQPNLFLQSLYSFPCVQNQLFGFGGYTFTRPCLGLEGASAVVGLCYPFGSSRRKD